MTSDFYQIHIAPYAGIIIKICRAYTSTKEDFDDYYQEVCLQVWRSYDSFNNQSQWSTWIYRVSLNVCMTLLKKSKSKQQVFVSDQLPTELIEDCASSHHDDIEHLYAAIRQLSEIDRAVILLYLEQQSYEDIASIIGVTSNTIGVRINRIKQRLNKILTLEDKRDD